MAPRQSAAAASKTGGFRPMDIRYSCNQRDFKRYTTEEVRNEFLITNLYKADEMVAVYSHVDRMVTLGKSPAAMRRSLPCPTCSWAAIPSTWLNFRFSGSPHSM